MSSVAVSVIIPTHNAAEFLADALESVRVQTLREFECIIVDDSSIDDSRLIAQRFIESDSRFKLIASADGKGAAAARNTGIAEANGRWLAILDADDLFLPNRLEQLIRIGDEAQADLIFDEQLVTEFPAASSSHRAFGLTRRDAAFTQEDFFLGSRLFRKSFPIGYMKPLMRPEFLRRIAAAYDSSVASGEDFLFYAQLFAARPRCIATNFSGYVYRRRRGSLSRSEEHLHLHAQLGERVLRQFGGQLSFCSRSALAGRARDFDDVAKAMPALTLLRQREWLRLAGLLIAQPRIAGTCARLLQTRAIRFWSAFSGPVALLPTKHFRSR